MTQQGIDGVQPSQGRSTHDAIMAVKINKLSSSGEFARGYLAGAADMQRSAAMVAKAHLDGVPVAGKTSDRGM